MNILKMISNHLKMITNHFQMVSTSIYYIFIIISNSIGIEKINIIIEYNDYLFNWKLPIILMIDP